VRRALGPELDSLDDSEESLAFVDFYISRVRDGGKLSDEVLQLVGGALGVYLGEVARTKFGGRWVALPPEPVAQPAESSAEPAETAQPGGAGTPILDSIDDPAGWRLQLEAAPLLVDPIGMAKSALAWQAPPEALKDPETGDEPAAEEDPVGFATTPELTAPLRAALARLPPVSMDYYYSLTGRFETLSYVVELLAELLLAGKRSEPKRKKAPAAPSVRAKKGS
jgi:hypothetical protein